MASPREQEDFLYFLYFRGTKKLSAWSNNRPTEMAEIAEIAAQSEGNKISFISFISVGQKTIRMR